MAPAFSTRPPLFLSRFILTLAIAHIAAGVGLQAYGFLTNNPAVLKAYFDYAAPAVLLVFGALQLSCAFLAHREFSSNQPLALAWLYIMTASVCGLLSTLLNQFLALNTALNPLTYWLHGNTADARILIERIGAVIGGPVELVLFGIGLYLALDVYRKLGMVANLRSTEFGWIVIMMLYTIGVLSVILKTLRADPSTLTAEHILMWSQYCVLSVLFVEGVFLFRSARELGGGYLSKVWSAFAIGIFITSCYSLLVWLGTRGIISRDSVVTSYVWYARCAVLALAPAYQWEAIRAAKRIGRRTAEIGVTSPIRQNEG